MIMEATKTLLNNYALVDETGQLIDWTPGQLEIIDCIVQRKAPDGKNRIQIIASTRYGKSLAVAAGLVIRASLNPERWAIVAGTKEKARIIMEYVTMFSLDCALIRTQLDVEESLDKLRMRRSQDRLTYKRRGEVRVYSADSTRITETSKSLMGFGAPNVIGDESALIPDILQATIMRMLGDKTDNFLVKIGNPFNRNHFLRTWNNDRYYKIFIDYQQGIKEGRYSEDYINEMREEALFDILYACKFPDADSIDALGWIPLLTDLDIERAFVDEDNLFGNKRLGCDVAGGGRNYSAIVLRAFNLAKKMYKEQEPDTMEFATKIMALARALQIKDRDIFLDSVGVGKGVYDHIKKVISKVVGVEGGREPRSPRYSNLRAEMYWRAREWILHGGKLQRDKDWLQLANIKYKVADGTGKLKIMSKEEMLRNGIDSPDIADSFAMTFAREEDPPEAQEQAVVNEPDFDPYDSIETA